MDDHRILWTIRHDDALLECLLISCCTGAELQLRRWHAAEPGPEVLLRELYPSKSDLYERARQLRIEHAEA